jgi:hypothetical protein
MTRSLLVFAVADGGSGAAPGCGALFVAEGLRTPLPLLTGAPAGFR